MTLLVKFTYFDAKEFEVEIEDGALDELTRCLANKTVYYSEKYGAGIWVPIASIRFFEVYKIDAQGKRVLGQTVTPEIDYPTTVINGE
jgi:hypothetical protein